MTEESYVKYTWTIFFILALLLAFASTGQLLGMSSGRFQAPAGLGAGVFAMAIAAVPFRRGEKWAWYVSWIWPVLFGINTVIFYPDPGWQFDFSLIFVVSAALLISLRNFFPRKAIS